MIAAKVIWKLETMPPAALRLALVAGMAAVALRGVVGQQPQQDAVGQTGTIHGVVLSVADGKPIAGAEVALVSTKAAVLTDERGRFEFDGVPFGQVVLVAKKPQLLCGSTFATQGPLPECVKSVDVYQKEVGVTLTMLPQAVITGRIVDQIGNPVQGLHVMLLHKQIDDGRYALDAVGMAQKDTDADGRFRLAELVPGEYVLKTITMGDPADGRHYDDHGYAATYYPGTLNKSEAKPIEIHAGDDVTANMTVKNEKFTEVTVAVSLNQPWKTGAVGSDVKGEDPDMRIYAIWDADQGVVRLFAPAGKYQLGFGIFPPADPNTGDQVHWPDGSKLPFNGSETFTLGDQPLHMNEVLTQQSRPVTVPLRVEAVLTEQEKVKAAATPAEPYNAPGAQFELTGGGVTFNNQMSWRYGQGPSEFEFKDLAPGSYVITGGPYCCNTGAYVASLTCGSVDLLNQPLVIGRETPACGIEAVIRDDAARVGFGLTPEAEGKLAAAGINVVDVALIPVDEELEAPYSGLVWRGSNPKMDPIRPGKYVAFLFDGRQLAWREPDVRKRMMELGTVVTVGPKEQKTVLLDWLPEFNDPHRQASGVALGQLLP
jgi:hypothetical protein